MRADDRKALLADAAYNRGNALAPVERLDQGLEDLTIRLSPNRATAKLHDDLDEIAILSDQHKRSKF